MDFVRLRVLNPFSCVLKPPTDRLKLSWRYAQRHFSKDGHLVLVQVCLQSTFQIEKHVKCFTKEWKWGWSAAECLSKSGFPKASQAYSINNHIYSLIQTTILVYVSLSLTVREFLTYLIKVPLNQAQLYARLLSLSDGCIAVYDVNSLLSSLCRLTAEQFWRMSAGLLQEKKHHWLSRSSFTPKRKVSLNERCSCTIEDQPRS